MAITATQLIGRDGELVIGNSITRWESCQVEHGVDEEAAIAADSVEREAVFTTRYLTGSFTGFTGAASDGASGYLPEVGDLIDELTFTVSEGVSGTGGNELFASATAGVTNIKVTKITRNLVQGAFKHTVEFSSGKLNSPPAIA